MRRVVSLGIVTLLLLSVVAEVWAAEFKVGGVYTAWGLSQNNFFLGKNEGKDNYWVQMMRFKVQAIASENLKAVIRFDIAQGWWEVDNVNRTKYGASGLFDNKDTNFLMHVDQAYVDFKVPNLPINMRVGRMWYGLGNKLVLDNNLEGVQADVKLGKGKLRLGWAKLSEGVDGLTDNAKVSADVYGNTDGEDADLLLANYGCKGEKHQLSVFGLYYADRGDNDGTTYLVNGLDYFRARFTPNISSLTILGMSGSLKAGKFSVVGEFNFLTGKDDVANNTHDAKQRYDINYGDISGYNIYLKPSYALGGLTLGGVFGLGSGDDDKTGGKSNVNKLRTSGFFYVTEIWEDSIMPDEEGITPQGLGAPNTRGYREFENTTLIQLNATYKLMPKVKVFGSYTIIKATQPIYAWSTATDEAGSYWIMGTDNSKDIGSEIDFKIDLGIYSNLGWTVRGGYFMPGDACGYLIHGTNKWKENVLELKTTLTYKF